ncbi:MAG: alpha/beta fold hydrolase, partial [Flavobacteriaceae bacterium]
MLNYTVYRLEEKKPWVTFIHGAGGSSTIWFKQIKSFSKFFNLLLIDLRGHGKSKHHLLDLGNSTYTFDAIAEEIVEVLDHENIQKSHFMGISLGTILIRG